MLSDLNNSMTIAWDKEATRQKIQELRENNPNFKKFFCKHSRLYKEVLSRPNQDPCDNNYDCANCQNYYDNISFDSISRLLDINDWARQNEQTGRNCRLTIHKVFLYAFWAQVPIQDILVLNKGYKFNEKGIIIKEGDENND